MIRDQVEDVLYRLFKTPITLLIPKGSDYGDFAFHINQLKKGKQQMSITEVVKKLQKSDFFINVTELNGFINLYVNSNIFLSELHLILKKKNTYGITPQKKYRINLEYGDPNTHKLPHIGHLYSYVYGESLSRILEATGNTVYRTSYQGDIGLHVAKCLYEVQKNKQKIPALKTINDKAHFLQKCYQTGSKNYEEDENAKAEIDSLNKLIYDKDPSIFTLWEATRKWSLEYYKEFENRLDIKYDKHYFESETAQIGKEMVLKNLDTVFIKNDGAIIFEGKKYGLHTRVFINKFGNPTYEAKDVGLIKLKMKDWSFDKAIITTANEQNEYFKVVIQAMQILMPELVGKVTHFGFGMIDLKLSKMSSRTGNIISGNELVDTTVDAVKKIMEGKNGDNTIAEKIGLASIKYAFLKSEAKKNIQFDLKESIAVSGNSAPYLLYTFARTQSILKKVHQNISVPKKIGSIIPEDNTLLQLLTRFPYAVLSSGENFAPHLLCNYLYEVAKTFNTLYEKYPILTAKNDTKQLRLAQTQGTGFILQTGLYLLGIEALPQI